LIGQHTKGLAMQKASVRALAVATGIIFGAAGAQAASLLLNGGFEDGVYTSGGNPNVPNDWDSTAAFDRAPNSG
jgi:hypothetical protein